jgi:hypothetical protein
MVKSVYFGLIIIILLLSIIVLIFFINKKKVERFRNSYEDSCTNIHIEDDILSANCAIKNSSNDCPRDYSISCMKLEENEDYDDEDDNENDEDDNENDDDDDYYDKSDNCPCSKLFVRKCGNRDISNQDGVLKC